jgi:hypothetical protein
MSQTVSDLRPGYVIRYSPGFDPDSDAAPVVDMKPVEHKRQ